MNTHLFDLKNLSGGLPAMIGGAGGWLIVGVLTLCVSVNVLADTQVDVHEYLPSQVEWTQSGEWNTLTLLDEVDWHGAGVPSDEAVYIAFDGDYDNVFLIPAMERDTAWYLLIDATAYPSNLVYEQLSPAGSGSGGVASEPNPFPSPTAGVVLLSLIPLILGRSSTPGCLVSPDTC